MMLLADQEQGTCRSIELPNFFDKNRTDILAANDKNSFSSENTIKKIE